MGKPFYDSEYTTTWIAEQQYLASHGVKYTFVKKVDGLTTFKYKKCKKLFDTLAKFYTGLNIID